MLGEADGDARLFRAFLERSGGLVQLADFVRAIEDYVRRIARRLVLEDALPTDWNDLIIGEKSDP